ncbi:MAG: 2-hydroxychromene-2-carboxylate isomerase [Hyphomicrobiales bacterium]|nr:2-hydroxychromene-2-carboxylate isomerase [Hyphomicrobiales bacterium]
MPSRPSLDFWFDFASTYSYLSVMRIGRLADDAAVEIRWRPFLLGPIFAAQGWNNSPFNLFPAKGRYMWRDMERRCQKYGLPLKRPAPFPQNSLSCARVALAGRDAGWTPPFTKACFHLGFGEGRSIQDEAVIVEALRVANIDAQAALSQSKSEDIKGRLKAETELAKSLGIFGAPAFVTQDGEIFWGDDRLEDAIEWVRQ